MFGRACPSIEDQAVLHAMVAQFDFDAAVRAFEQERYGDSAQAIAIAKELREMGLNMLHHATHELSEMDDEPDEYLICEIDEVACDGMGHFWSAFDEDTRRWYSVDGICPHRDHNWQVMADEWEQQHPENV